MYTYNYYIVVLGHKNLKLRLMKSIMCLQRNAVLSCLEWTWVSLFPTVSKHTKLAARCLILAWCWTMHQRLMWVYASWHENLALCATWGQLQKPNEGANLPCSVCTEKPVTLLLFPFFLFFSSRELLVFFVRNSVLTCAVHKYLSTVSLSSVYMFWLCSLRVPLTLHQPQSMHSVITFLRF